MEHIYCDVCKKEVVDPVPNITLFPYAHIDICEDCYEDLNVAVKTTVREKSPFNFAWYDDLRMQLLKQGMQRGRIEVKRSR
jgi:hypothetical protein